MKLECDKNSLAEAISGVSRAVTMRSSVPALEGILFKAEGNTLTLTGYDLEMGITTQIDARIRDEGAVVLSAKLIGDMIRRLPSEQVEIECSENLITTVKGGITEYNIHRHLRIRLSRTAGRRLPAGQRREHQRRTARSRDGRFGAQRDDRNHHLRRFAG